eukprot:Gb_19132 [translate_table: standard]
MADLNNKSIQNIATRGDEAKARDGTNRNGQKDPHQTNIKINALQGQSSQGEECGEIPSEDMVVTEDMSQQAYKDNEDLEGCLKRAYQQQKKLNPSTQFDTDIQVGSFEDIIKRMENNEESSEWGNVVFIPPGFDALNHVGKQLLSRSSSNGSALC